MVKKSLITILFIFALVGGSNAESWDDFSDLDRMWDAQKTIPNQDYEDVVEKLEEKKIENETKVKKKKWKKLFGTGSILHKELDPEGEINEFVNIKSESEGVLINIPVQLLIDGKEIERGYYKAFPEVDEENKKKYINLYQSQFLKAKIEVTETDDDYGEENLDFAKILPIDEKFVKLIFGSLKFNAFAYIPYSY